MTGSITVAGARRSSACSCSRRPAASATTRSRRASRRSRRSARPTASRSSRPRTRPQFTDANLATFDVVVFMSTTGEILNDAQQTAFESYIKGGGGFAGVHAASDTEYTLAVVRRAGRRLLPQPPARNAHRGGQDRGRRRAVHDRPSGRAGRARTSGTTSSTRSTPAVNGNTTVADYSPRARQVKVLATVDESTYDEEDGNTIDDDHPVAWCSDFDGGRSWYTAMGHTQASFSDAAVPRAPARRPAHRGRRRRRLRRAAHDCRRRRRTSRRSRSTTTRTPRWRSTSPMTGARSTSSSTVVSRCGTRPRARRRRSARSRSRSATRTASSASSSRENFDTTGHIYLAYSALPDSTGTNRVSRFTLTGNTLGQEQIIYTWQHQRQECCHTGGSLEWGANGDLYISTGDNTNPFAHGFNPTDERPGRADLGRPAHVGQHEQPERQDPAHPADPERHRRCRASARRTRSRRATCSPWARLRPCPRSTRWASGTRSGSTSTRRPAGS